jgi:arylsulfatase A-like enzyme
VGRDLAIATLLLLTACEQPAPRSEGLRPNVLVVVSDTLRRDHLPVYGYERDVSPRIDAFAQTSAVFERAYAQSPSTKPSIASLFTSLHPHQHGTVYNEHVLSSDFVTLAEVFREAGYDTAGFTENPMIGSEFDFDQGFGVYELHAKRHGRGSARADGFDEAVSDWLESRRERECFLYVHYVDPHSPYAPPAEFRGRFHAAEGAAGEGLRVDSRQLAQREKAIARYDEEILYVDSRFGGLLDRLEALGLRSSTIVVFVSDHGEAFGEHGHFHHSKSVYAELIDIPLLISFPAKLAPGVRSEPVAHIDLFPTLLDLAGIPREGLALEGRSLASAEGAGLEDRVILSEHLREGWGTRQRALISGSWKLVEGLDTRARELYDLSSDGADAVNRLADAPDAQPAELAAAMDRLGAREFPAATRVELAGETLSALEALGYVTESENDATSGH